MLLSVVAFPVPRGLTRCISTIVTVPGSTGGFGQHKPSFLPWIDDAELVAFGVQHDRKIIVNVSDRRAERLKPANLLFSYSATDVEMNPVALGFQINGFLKKQRRPITVDRDSGIGLGRQADCS